MRIVSPYAGVPFMGAPGASGPVFGSPPGSFAQGDRYVACPAGSPPGGKPLGRSSPAPQKFGEGSSNPATGQGGGDVATVRERRIPTVEVINPLFPLASAFLNRLSRLEAARLLSDPVQLLKELTYRDHLREETGKDPADEKGYREAWLEAARAVLALIGQEPPGKRQKAKIAPLPLLDEGPRTLSPALEKALRPYLDPQGVGGLIERLLADRNLERGTFPSEGDETLAAAAENIFHRHARSGEYRVVDELPESPGDFRGPEIQNGRQRISENGALVIDYGGIGRDPEVFLLSDAEIECRFYFAVKSNYTSVFWQRLTRVLDRAHMDRHPFQAKAFLTAKRYNESADPVVLFFRPIDQEYFYSVIVEMMDSLPLDWFHEDLKPPFAAQLLREGGRPVRGMSVGESPFQAQMSFNERVAKAVAWAVRAEELLLLLGREVTLEDRLQIMASHLEWFGVDLTNPAFNAAKGNLRAGVARFEHIWRRTDQGRAPRPQTAGRQIPAFYMKAMNGDPAFSFVEEGGRDFSVGRSKECRFSLPKWNALSRRHCEFFVKDGIWHVKDLASTNGTSVNGKRIYDSVVKNGDVIEAGGRTWRVCLELPDGETDMELMLKNLKYLVYGARLNEEAPKDVERREALRVQVGTFSLDASGKIVGTHTRWPFDIGNRSPTKTGLIARSSFFDAILFDGRLVWHKDISHLNPAQQAAVRALYNECSGAREAMERECPGLLKDVLEWLQDK